MAAVRKDQKYFVVETEHEEVQADSLVVATGGLSIPKIGATDFGYRLARQFELPVTDVRAGLVPLTFSASVLAFCKALAGLSVDAMVSVRQLVSEKGCFSLIAACLVHLCCKSVHTGRLEKSS